MTAGLKIREGWRDSSTVGHFMFRIRNLTTGKDVIDADANSPIPVVFETPSLDEANEALVRVNDLKQLNPLHCQDEFEIYASVADN